ISGDNSFSLNAKLTNRGTVTIASGSLVRSNSLSSTAPAFIDNTATGTINITTAQLPVVSNTPPSQITNSGTINVMGTQTTIGWDVSNTGNGTIVVQAGTLTFNTGTVFSSRPITANAGAIVEFNKHATFNSGASLQGAGTFKATGDGAITINADLPS